MKKICKRFFWTIAIAYWPILFLLSFHLSFFGWVDISWSMFLVLLSLEHLFLFSFPYYLAFLGIVSSVCSLFEKRTRSAAHRIVHFICVLLCVGAFVTLFDIREYAYFAYIMMGAWLASKIVLGAVLLYGRSREREMAKSGIFWFLIIVILAATWYATMLLPY